MNYAKTPPIKGSISRIELFRLRLDRGICEQLDHHKNAPPTRCRRKAFDVVNVEADLDGSIGFRVVGPFLMCQQHAEARGL